MSHAHTKIAAIILAGGAAKRFGYPKPLLLWQGQSFLYHITKAAMAGQLSPIIIVSGAYTEQLQLIAQELLVQIIHNPHWEQGQSTSVKAGVSALPIETEAAIFLLADQPLITAALLQKMALTYNQTHAPVIAPFIGEKRGNPLLFSRETFQDLTKLKGDEGGRTILNMYPMLKLNWDDSSILFDVDTPQDYERLKLITPQSRATNTSGTSLSS